MVKIERLLLHIFWIMADPSLTTSTIKSPVHLSMLLNKIYGIDLFDENLFRRHNQTAGSYGYHSKYTFACVYVCMTFVEYICVCVCVHMCVLTCIYVTHHWSGPFIDATMRQSICRRVSLGV